jgi:hypothetical protein
MASCVKQINQVLLAKIEMNSEPQNRRMSKDGIAALCLVIKIDSHQYLDGCQGYQSGEGFSREQ